MQNDKMTFMDQAERLKETLGGIPAGTWNGQYISQLGQTIRRDPTYQKYLPEIEKEAPFRGEGAPFLTVLTRTQGRRPQMLRETLLTLCGQSDGDFEVLLVGHKVDAEQRASVEEIIDEQPDWMRRKIRFITVDTGNRTAPLNLGFARARGSYIAILDDDDIVFDHWVEELHRAAGEHPGMTLHAYVIAQGWKAVKTPSGEAAPRAAETPVGQYCKDFSMPDQLYLNNCPTCGLAFPAYAFQRLGVVFDETLTTTEDWDFLMRTVFLTGLWDIRETTSMYRLWRNAESSVTVHRKKEWEKNHRYIREKFANSYILFPPQANRELASTETSILGQRAKIQKELSRYFFCSLFFDLGEGLSLEDSMVEAAMFEQERFKVKFPIPEDFAGAKGIRFDPGEKGFLILKDVKVTLELESGEKRVLTLGDGGIHNGYSFAEGLLFVWRDPWVMWPCDIPAGLETVTVTGAINDDLSLQDLKILRGIIPRLALQNLRNRLHGKK